MRAGLGAIIPLQLLTTLSPLEMELRTCGLPYINLEFLKVSSLGGLGSQALAAGTCPGTPCVPGALSPCVGEPCPPPVTVE